MEVRWPAIEKDRFCITRPKGQGFLRKASRLTTFSPLCSPPALSPFSVLSAFDAAYAAYNDFQHAIERYWTIRHLAQEHIGELDAVVMKDGFVRAETLPLVFKALGCEPLARGTRVRVRVTGSDPLTLDVHASLLARLDEAAAEPADTDDSTEEDLAEAAAPLALAIDLDDAPAEAAAPTA